MSDALYDAAGSYGRDWDEGVLSEHLSRAAAAGLVVTTAEDGAMSVTDGTNTLPVVCSEIIAIRTEDGVSDGRCGIPIVKASPFCDGHYAEGWDSEDLCEHSMPAYQCAGPGHYPTDV